MVYCPELFVWVSQEPFPNKNMEGRLPKETFLSPFMEL
uniref:Neuronal reration related protein n=2 Tax=Rhinopithecus TaxID=542827 RepID=A0A2K6LTY1_RHIBE